MKILHTSDWHLGKRLFKLDRSNEHQKFLDWILSTIKSHQIDVLLIAGDIFDTPTPPHSSLEMFYEFLHRLSTQTSAMTYIIAGNHDSGQLIEAPSKLLLSHRVKVWGKLSAHKEDHWTQIHIRDEKIDLCAIPFFRSYELLPQGEGDALKALDHYLDNESMNPKLLMLHHLAGIFEEAGTEQAIHLTGVESIPKESLAKFDYVALGHIHKPQKIADNAYYSGSPLPMRFSESQNKSVLELTLKDNKFEVQKIDIPVFRQIIQVNVTEQNWQEKIKALEVLSELTPMVEIKMTLDAPVIGLVDKVRAAIEKKGMELLSYQPHFTGENKAAEKNDKLFELTPVDLFKEFYKQKFPEAPEVTSELENDFKELLLRISHEDSQTET